MVRLASRFWGARSSVPKTLFNGPEYLGPELLHPFLQFVDALTVAPYAEGGWAQGPSDRIAGTHERRRAFALVLDEVPCSPPLALSALHSQASWMWCRCYVLVRSSLLPDPSMRW
jgi:hypothetical protein